MTEPEKPSANGASTLAGLDASQLLQLCERQASTAVRREQELDDYRLRDLERRSDLAEGGYKRSPIDWEDLENRSPPERDWAIRGWLPMGHVTLLAGRGGVGKTLLAQCISSRLCTLQPYIDEIPKARRVLFWAGEDDVNELWRRQAAIAKQMGEPLSTFEDLLFVESFIDKDMTLAAPAIGSLQPTPLMQELASQVRDYKADFVWLDSVARIFGGSENDRHQVTQLITWLTRAAGAAGVGLIGHPGKAQGSEYSGSTAWEGSVRARLFLGNRLPDQQQDEDGDAEVLYLSRRKANYAPQDWRRLRFMDGALIPDATSAATQYGGEFAKDAVLRTVCKLAESNIFGNGGKRSGDYLPRLAKEYGMLDGLGERQFAAAMRELLLEKRLTAKQVGTYSNRSPKLGLVIP